MSGGAADPLQRVSCRLHGLLKAKDCLAIFSVPSRFLCEWPSLPGSGGCRGSTIEGILPAARAAEGKRLPSSVGNPVSVFGPGE